MENEIDTSWDPGNLGTEIEYGEENIEYEDGEETDMMKRTWTPEVKMINKKTGMVCWTRIANGENTWEKITMPQTILETPAAKTDFEMAAVLREAADFIELNVDN